jgi:4a-hydroxytetrahydrobiopterin dehydratase
LSKATNDEVQAVLVELVGWTLEDSMFYREHGFRDIVGALGFLAQAALQAWRSADHPEWFNVYSQVVVDLSTHETGGITE